MINLAIHDIWTWLYDSNGRTIKSDDYVQPSPARSPFVIEGYPASTIPSIDWTNIYESIFQQPAQDIKKISGSRDYLIALLEAVNQALDTGSGSATFQDSEGIKKVVVEIK